MIRTILVDDMPKARRMLRRMLEEINEVQIEGEFTTAVEAIDYIREHEVDLVFMDIEMPGISGTEGTKIIAELDPAPLVVFVTAYADHMLEAWKTEAIYYIVKPFQEEDILEAIQKYKLVVGKRLHKSEAIITHSSMHNNIQKNIQISCFPVFNVKIDGVTVSFKSKRSKELMAYLIHCRGSWVDNGDICATLLEDMEEDKAKNNLRTYLRRLKLILDEAGITDVIEQTYGKIRLNTENMECDYYQYLEGQTQLFKGEYLREYSWAEPVVATMYSDIIGKNTI